MELNPKITNFSKLEVDALNNAFDYSDSEGFEQIVDRTVRANNELIDTQNVLKRVGNSFNKTKVIPMMLYTDEFTATQLTVLLEMIKFCMEKSAEGKSDDVKEFSINVRIKNRSNSDFVFSIGDEPMDSLPYEKDVFIGH